MTILEFKKHFQAGLSHLYTESESALLFSVFVERITGFEARLQRRFYHQQLLLQDEEQLNTVLKDLKSGKPYQQILGEALFFGKKFLVDENVLIPRPETEELLELAVERIKNQEFKILDVGTGSGIIPIILKNAFPEAEVSALDISEKALETAKKNAALHRSDIHFFQMDFLKEFPSETYDIIISNPPYIARSEESEIADSVKEFEPKTALFSPVEDALIFYRKIAEFAQTNLTEQGMIFMEINQKYGNETLELFKDFRTAELHLDISGNNRIIFVQN